ncbi:antibiotic biosynthesis monooxygenase family protein [Litorilituus lipolyticus]|uniref:Antibiotic biosynthesis monooxygenase n=1 Tax=Litorilituus lipolyticus TaxID=2491017 RepID=A0A502KXU1_9GAMM|nr:antibiotic biosynthesis monooxygenase [Litorilituus lipolyticus]TPH16468.1 antibiotic biosynthesis monooxygenase [Litorilituus lipolyticus]
MSNLIKTPPPPYYAVIFTSTRTNVDNGYDETASKMAELAKQQPGFLGIESARDSLGITVSYWTCLEAIKQWKSHAEHIKAQKEGRDSWYASFNVRIAKVERDYSL